MANVSESLKGIWLKSMEAISDTASRIATNTKHKVNEMNVVNRRSEILKDFGAKSYELWLKGEQFPMELDQLLSELHQLETELNEIRMAKAAAKPAPAAPVAPVVPQEEATEETVTFEEKVEELVDKAEDALENIGDNIEEAVEELKDKIFGEDPIDDCGETVPVIEVEEAEADETEVEAVGETLLADEETVPAIKVEE